MSADELDLPVLKESWREEVLNSINWDYPGLEKAKKLFLAKDKKGASAEFVKYLRKKKNISQLRLAMELNMNQNSISRYENGTREADYATLIKFADYFDVSIDYLLERTDNPEISR